MTTRIKNTNTGLEDRTNASLTHANTMIALPLAGLALLAAYAAFQPYDNSELHFDGKIDGEKVTYHETGRFPFTGANDYLRVQRDDGTIINFTSHNNRLLEVNVWKDGQRSDCWTASEKPSGCPLEEDPSLLRVVYTEKILLANGVAKEKEREQ